MQELFLERAVTEDNTGVLEPVITAAYSLDPITPFELSVIANKVNRQLGYDLFEDFGYERLRLDVSRVARAVQLNAVKDLRQEVE